MVHFAASPSSGAARHLLPEGEKNWSGVCFGTMPLIPLPLGERVDRPQAETGEGGSPTLEASDRTFP